jgi:hypothetical protein
MKQWDIVLYPFTDAGPHPAVILSNFTEVRGNVSEARQRAIARKIAECLRLPL